MRVTLPLFKIFAHYGHENLRILAHKISAPQCGAAQYAPIGAPDAQNSLRILAHELFAHFCQKKSCVLSPHKKFLASRRTNFFALRRTKVGAPDAQKLVPVMRKK
jgi:hypothetical protein